MWFIFLIFLSRSKFWRWKQKTILPNLSGNGRGLGDRLRLLKRERAITTQTGFRIERHKPEETALHQIIETHLSAFLASANER
jgi:hypothetical protein